MKVDYTTRPIDPANAAGFNKAMARMARDYPSVFDRLKVIKVQDLEEMKRTDPYEAARTVTAIFSGPGA